MACACGHACGRQRTTLCSRFSVLPSRLDLGNYFSIVVLNTITKGTDRRKFVLPYNSRGLESIMVGSAWHRSKKLTAHILNGQLEADKRNCK